MNEPKATSDTDFHPVIFTDGTHYFSELAKKYIQHTKGFFILAPSGAGKTYFIHNQTEKHWIDGDDIWPETLADPTGPEWDYDFELIQEVNNRSDVITQQANKQGFWIVGSSNHWYEPSAIVLPPWEQHVNYIRKRENTVYDGGATEADLDGVKAHREWIATWEQKGVPRFDSVQEAAEYIAKLYKSTK